MKGTYPPHTVLVREDDGFPVLKGLAGSTLVATEFTADVGDRKLRTEKGQIFDALRTDPTVPIEGSVDLLVTRLDCRLPPPIPASPVYPIRIVVEKRVGPRIHVVPIPMLLVRSE